VVADLLSYCRSNQSAPHPLAVDNPDNHILTNRFHSHLPQLIPRRFAISPLQKEILSFAVHTKTEIESGAAGPNSVSKWESPITSSSVTYLDKSPSSLADPSFRFTAPPNGTNQVELLGTVRHQWFQTLSKMPQAMWLRRFGTISNQAPFTLKGELGFYPPSDHSFWPLSP
jgi:hypothetical protein